MDSRDIDPAAAPKAITPTRLEELQTEELLKKDIVAQARVHYGPFLPIGSTFHVVTELDTMYDNEDMVHKKMSKAFLIVFPVLNNSTTWTCINANEAVSYSIIDALEDLLRKLQGGYRDKTHEFSLFVGMTSDVVKQSHATDPRDYR